MFTNFETKFIFQLTTRRVIGQYTKFCTPQTPQTALEGKPNTTFVLPNSPQNALQGGPDTQSALPIFSQKCLTRDPAQNVYSNTEFIPWGAGRVTARPAAVLLRRPADLRRICVAAGLIGAVRGCGKNQHPQTTPMRFS